MPENANAHDSGDCLPDCAHPDHEYEDADFDIDLLFDGLWELARRFKPRTSHRPIEDLDLPDPEGPVQL
jgi:hypothetical protein